MRLFTSPTSPFGRKVAVLILETGLSDRVTQVATSGTPIAPGTMPLDRNPLGKIPTLERDDGAPLYDSRVICRYLDDLTGAGFYGPASKIWDVLTLEALADGMLDAAILMAYETRLRPEEIRFPDWIEGQWTKVTRALAALETTWIDHLHGPLGIGQIAVGCVLGYLDFRHGARNWREGHPKLAEWEAGFAQRPSMKATVPA